METKILNTDQKDEFFKVYREIFRGAPFYEEFSDDKLNKLFIQAISSNAFAPIAVNEDGEIIGFGLCIPIQEYGNEEGKKMLSQFVNLESNLYVRDVAVLNNYRKKGLGNNFFSMMIEYARENGYKSLSMMTNEVGSMSKGIAVKQGFTETGLVQEVSSLRVGGSQPEPDRRTFLTLEL